MDMKDLRYAGAGGRQGLRQTPPWAHGSKSAR
jgi:hypothetical protein